jgi:hypothetical protein
MADFEQFWMIICGKMVLPEVAKDIMLEAWGQVKTIGGYSQPRRTRPLSGYNLFMKDQLLDGDLSGSARMKEVGRRWRDLTPEQQNVWNDKASELLPQAPSPPPMPVSPPLDAPEPTRRAPTGYNLFLKHTMSEFKERKVPAQQRMKQIGGQWGRLTVQEKLEWKHKAEEVRQDKADEEDEDEDVGKESLLKEEESHHESL